MNSVVRRMLKVTCIQADGVVRMLDNIEPGRSLMEVARAGGVAGYWVIVVEPAPAPPAMSMSTLNGSRR